MPLGLEPGRAGDKKKKKRGANEYNEKELEPVQELWGGKAYRGSYCCSVVLLVFACC